VFAQTESQAELFSALGAKSVTVSGSIKFDAKHPADLSKRVADLQQHLSSRPFILGASTHEGEESILLEAFLRLDDAALLVLAPRHSHRAGAVEAMLNSRSISFQRHSDGVALDAHSRVYLLDTMGELIYFYGACQIAFVGGSLVDVGGHNPMEPGGLGKPILMGPYRRNIKDIAGQFAEAGALLDVTDADDTYAALDVLVSEPERRLTMSRAALEVMARNRGALDRVFDVILPMLRENKP
jgi:3-deoxy-D-manno-octulosonic-acid transferase